MEEKFIKFYVLVSLWFWAGILLSTALRKAFCEMHRRLAERIYDATFGQAIKLFRKLVASISTRFKKAMLYMEESSYELRVKVARTLVSKELLEELNHKNLVSAIARAKQLDQGDSGVIWDDLETMADLATGKQVGYQGRKTSVDTAFKLCNTDFFEQLITRIPRAQERILLALDQIEDSSPYESVRNEAYRKFIRQ